MNGSGGIVDWRLAEQTAVAVAGSPEPGRRSYGRAQVAAACENAIVVAAAYSRMAIPDRPPPAELVDRRQWSRAALGTLGEASAPLEARLAAGLSLPGPLGGAVRRVIGAGAGAEAGFAVGFAARRVLGQYDIALIGAERPARLLFVGPNLDRARAELDADPELFLRWVALHEVTHVLQFGAVPWLAQHLRELVGRLIEGAAGGIDPGQVAELAKRFLRDPRQVVRTILRGELAHALADAPTRATLDRVQATMTVIEGHAEHVMDVCAADDPRLAELRIRLERRRSSRGGLAEAIARLLGLDLKLRQYELGKRFWDEVVDERGEAALEQVWASVASLPDLAELESPGRWLERVAAPLATG